MSKAISNHTEPVQNVEPSVGLTMEHILEAVDSRTEHNDEAGRDTLDTDPPAKQRSNLRLALVLLALFLSLFVAALDATIVATAVPVISHDLKSAAGYTWIGGAYLLANAAAAPIWGKISDIWGRKLIMLTAVALFFVASTICATASTMEVLIAGRTIQGVAGGGLILLVHIAVSDLFSVRQRSLFMGLTEGVWAVAGGVGPILGGVFASLISWRWCFYINLPICGLAFALLLFFLDIKHEHTSFVTGIRAIDWYGITAFLACTLMILLGLDFGGVIFPWSSAKVICLIVIGFCMIFVFIYSEARLAKYPLIPLNLFKDTSNLASLGVGFFHGLAFMPAEYYIPLYYQAVKQASPLRSGILFMPFIVATAGVGVLTGIIIHKTGRYRELMWIGSALLTLGMGLFTLLDTSSSTGEVIGLTILFGCGSGMLFEPPLIAIQTRSDQQDVATATSTFSFCRCIALAISIIIGGVVFQDSMNVESAALRRQGLPENITMQLTGKEAAANVALAGQLTDPAQRLAVQGAFAWSMRNMWIMYTVFAALCLVSSLFIRTSVLSKSHTETVTGIRKEKRPSDDM